MPMKLPFELCVVNFRFAFVFDRHHLFAPRYNIAPRQKVPVIVPESSGSRGHKVF
jgi:putative SOS response-associated peptidase YedK